VSPSKEYWASIAQVLPVIAVGIVLEVRAITASWTRETARWYKAIQASIWSITLIALAYGENASVKALRGVEASTWWPTAIEAAISAGLGILVISPAMEIFLRGYAESVAGLLAWLPMRPLTFWRLDRRALSLIRQRGRLLGHKHHLLYLALALARERDAEYLKQMQALGEAQNANLSSQQLTELRRDRDRLSAWREGFIEDRAQLEHMVFAARSEKQRYRESRDDYMQKRKEWRGRFREGRAEVKSDLIEFFSNFSVATSDVSPARMTTSAPPTETSTTPARGEAD